MCGGLEKEIYTQNRPHQVSKREPKRATEPSKTPLRKSNEKGCQKGACEHQLWGPFLIEIH